MRIVLVPGMLAPPQWMHPLRDDLVAEGHDIYMFETWPTLTVMQYRDLLQQLRGGEPAVVIGHSLGGLLSIMAADRVPELFRGVIGLDSFVWGRVNLQVPYYEIRGWAGCLAPIRGADEVKRTLLPHSIVPLVSCVRRWVLKKVREIDESR